MVGFVLRIGALLVFLEHQTVDRFGIKQRRVEGVEVVVPDNDGTGFATMEIGIALGELGYFGIDGDHGVRELVLAGEGVDEGVAADDEVAHRTALIPPVAVATEEDGGAGGVVEEVALAYGAAWRTEERATGTVVAHNVALEFHLGCPRQVFHAPVLLAGNGGGKGIFAGDEKFAASEHAVPFCRTDGGDGGGERQVFHVLGTHEGDGVARVAPIEAPSLAVFKAAAQGVVVDTLAHLEIHAVNVDGIVHHAFIKAVVRHDFSLALGEVGGIGLGGEIAGIVGSAQAYAEFLERDAIATLGYESHAFGVVHLDIMQGGMDVVAHENAGTGTLPGAHGHDGAGHEAAVFPVGGQELAAAEVLHAGGVDAQVGGVVDDVAGIALESDAG